METYEFMKTMGERANRVNQVYSAWAKAHGVNYNILAVIYTAYKKDKCSQKHICEEWSLPKQTVNTTCQSLISSGIITQTQSADDRRGVTIKLTDKGIRFAKPIVVELLEIESRVLNILGQDAVQEFFNLYLTYVKNIEAEFSKSMKK